MAAVGLLKRALTFARATNLAFKVAMQSRQSIAAHDS